MTKKSLSAYIFIFVLIASINSKMTGINAILDNLQDQKKSQKEIFKAFHFLHNKSYSLNSEEAIKRYRIFKQNANWIKQQNSKEGKIIYGITKFSDMTFQEYSKNVLLSSEEMHKNLNQMKKNSSRFLKEKDQENTDQKEFHHHHHHHHHHEHHHHHHYEENPNIKEENSKEIINLKSSDFDWRGHDTPIKDQSACGSCWAFAAVSTIENVYNKLKGKITLFSEQYLVDCDNYDSGCDGGWPSNTFQWLTENGIVAENMLPYKATQNSCDPEQKKNEYKIIKAFKFYDKDLPFSSDEKSWDAMISQGPLVVAMDADFKEFQQYRPTELLPVNPNCSPTKLNHAVTAVASIMENGQRYIICRNSWGDSWGYKGYFKIAYNQNCQIVDYAFLPIVYDGQVPDNNPNPKPEPEIKNCITAYGRDGFNTPALGTYCDSTLIFKDLPAPHQITGVKYPEEIKGDYLYIGLFKYPYCLGDFNVIGESTEFPRDYYQYNIHAESIAFWKPAGQKCADFYTSDCMKGQKSFSICNNISDTDLVNFRELKNVRAIEQDFYTISSISFFTEPNFGGTEISLSSSVYLFNIATRTDLGNMFRNEQVRSVRLNYYDQVNKPLNIDNGKIKKVMRQGN